MTNNTYNEDVVIDIYKGNEKDLEKVIMCIDLQDDSYKEVLKAIFTKKLGTKKEVDDLLIKRRIKDELGTYPETAYDFVKSWIDNHEIKFNINGDVSSHNIESKKTKLFKEEIKTFSDEINEIDKNDEIEVNRITSTINQLRGGLSANLAELTSISILRKLRILRDDLSLRQFKDKQLEDALDEYIEDNKINIKTNSYLRVSHDGNASYNNEDIIWDRIVEGLFDTTALSKGAVINSLKKFIYQVKRKMVHKPIKNHSMVIISGKQGSGKTTFVEKLISPVSEMSTPANFEQLTDTRNMELFDMNVIFLDEMSRADRADIETVKNIITADKLGRRPLHTSKYVSINQNAVLIGCSNKNLDQIINDETGIRRFIPCKFKNNPDWSVLDDVDFIKLWQSVNEFGNDPIDEVVNEINNIQEEYRTKTSCEDWIKSLNGNDSTDIYKSGRDWYIKFQNFEETYFPNRRTSYNVWDKEMNRICDQRPDLGVKCIIREGIRRYSFTYGYVVDTEQKKKYVATTTDDGNLVVKEHEERQEPEVEQKVSNVKNSQIQRYLEKYKKNEELRKNNV